MNFQTAVRTCLLEKYVTFSGRARRSEFWWFALFNLIGNAVFGIIDGSMGSGMGQGGGLIGGLFSLAIFLPSISVSVRRLHDIGKSGWWLLIALVPVIGWLVLLYWYVQQGMAETNEFGDNPIA